MLLAASAKALKISQIHPAPIETYVNIHKSRNRALPSQIMQYKHAILLHKLYNEQLPEADFIELNFNQNLTSRQYHFKISKSNVFKIGSNS